MKRFFSTLPINIVDSFKGKNVFWHLLAIFLTFIFVISGVDWFYFTKLNHFTLYQSLFPAIILGAIVPIVVPLVLVLAGSMSTDKHLSKLGWMLAQAALIGSLISSTYKALTGRVQPDMANTLVDISNNFQFGFLEHGIFWGWPSSHTTIAFAMSTALITFFPKSKFIKYTALIYAFYIGIGISTSIHWFSEFVAGAIIGTVIGLTVGKNFSKK